MERREGMTCVGNRNSEGGGETKRKERSDLADRLTAKHPDNTAATQECQAPPAPSGGFWGQGTPRGAGTHHTQPHAPDMAGTGGTDRTDVPARRLTDSKRTSHSPRTQTSLAGAPCGGL